MAVKPPAFQFYAKDWTSSHSVSQMTMHERGIYITLLAAAWDSEDPGTLPLPVEATAKAARVDIRSLRFFLSRWATLERQDRPEIAERSSRCFVEIDGKLVNEKLRQNWLNYKEISEKRRKAAECRYTANAQQMHHPASAPASAPTPKSKEPPPTPSKGVHEAGPPADSLKGGENREPDDLFDQFWDVYPRHQKKLDAQRAWKSLHVSETKGLFDAILEGIAKYKRTEQWQNPTLIPHPGTFLRHRRWEDEIPDDGSGQRRGKASGAVHGDTGKYGDREPDIVVEV